MKNLINNLVQFDLMIQNVYFTCESIFVNYYVGRNCVRHRFRFFFSELLRLIDNTDNNVVGFVLATPL